MADSLKSWRVEPSRSRLEVKGSLWPHVNAHEGINEWGQRFLMVIFCLRGNDQWSIIWGVNRPQFFPLLLFCLKLHTYGQKWPVGGGITSGAPSAVAPPPARGLTMSTFRSLTAVIDVSSVFICRLCRRCSRQCFVSHGNLCFRRVKFGLADEWVTREERRAPRFHPWIRHRQTEMTCLIAPRRKQRGDVICWRFTADIPAISFHCG